MLFHPRADHSRRQARRRISPAARPAHAAGALGVAVARDRADVWLGSSHTQRVSICTPATCSRSAAPSNAARASPSVVSGGVLVTASAGNHGRALAKLDVCGTRTSCMPLSLSLSLSLSHSLTLPDVLLYEAVCHPGRPGLLLHSSLGNHDASPRSPPRTTLMCPPAPADLPHTHPRPHRRGVVGDRWR